MQTILPCDDPVLLIKFTKLHFAVVEHLARHVFKCACVTTVAVLSTKIILRKLVEAPLLTRALAFQLTFQPDGAVRRGFARFSAAMGDASEATASKSKAMINRANATIVRGHWWR